MKTFDECTKEQKIERWENVLRVLRALTPHQRRRHWNMGFFASVTDCGTVACAAGHCAFDPWFRRRGFAMDRKRIDAEYLTDGSNIGYTVPYFFGKEGSDDIFFKTDRRPVREVIKEVLAYIKSLRTE